MRRWWVAASLALLAGARAASPDAPPVTDWSTVPEVVVVDASAQGPAMWHIKKGDSEIWILGTVGLMPEKLAWNTRRLEAAIDGADAVFLPPEAHAGFLDFVGMSWFILMHRDALSMPGDQKLEASLPPALRARFVAAREQIGKKADRYDDDSPLLAGFKLFADYVDANKLTGRLPEQAAEKIARAKHVKVQRIAEYSAVPLVKEMLKLPPEAGRVCFENGLGDVETLGRHAVPAADAWAVGDIAGIKAHYSTPLFAGCVSQSHKFGEINSRAVEDTLKVVHAALGKPGKTVMLVNIGWLFRATGVADRLRGEGVVIEGPGDQASPIRDRGAEQK